MKFEFQAFHPYLTFVDGKKHLVQPDGEPSFAGWTSVCHPTAMNDDAQDLWRLGKCAFDALGEIKSKDEFDKLYEENIKAIRMLRIALGERLLKEENSPTFLDQDNERFYPDIDELSNATIIDITWRMWQSVVPPTQLPNILARCFLFNCLQEIDNVIIGMCLDGRYAVSGSIAAAQAYANYQVIESGSDKLKQIRSELAANAAMERYKNDPKQKEKVFVQECWALWQKRPDSYDGKASFARAMLDKCEHLQSQKKIEDWCRVWEAKAVTLPAQ